ncbi:MAG: hypothetical protein OEV91_06025 [Desulfobulbaceae bacterium]|nr:hypothetical protein [Desulfobulbaceae bacterium]
MGTITAQDIIDKVQIELHDLNAVRWPEAELLGWLNDWQKELTTINPAASVKSVAVQMAAGTKQKAPADAVGVVTVVRNMGAGSTPGKAVRGISLAMLDALIPGWHTETASGTTDYYTAEPGNDKNFYVYPPHPASPTYLELVYPCVPAEIAVIGDAITIDDIYAPSGIDYVLSRALSKDAEYAGEDGRAMAHYKKFVAMASVKESGSR